MPRRVLPSTGTLQTLRDPTDAGEQRFEQVPVLPLALTPALQQIDLHQVHRVDIRVAQLDRPLLCGIAVEERAAVFDRQHLLASGDVLGPDSRKELRSELR